MARLSLSLLGPFQVTLDRQPVTGFKSAKARALLAYLAVEADRTHRREVLAGLLWPDSPDRDALSNLRYALSNLRQVIGDRQAEPPFLLITRDTLQFNIASDYWLDVAAFTEAQAKTGHPEEGLSTLAEAFAFVEETDERHWEAELYRLRAELLLMQGHEAEAEASFHKAIEVARRQQAKSWELRAAIGLARLWQEQGRIDEARQMLAEIQD